MEGVPGRHPPHHPPHQQRYELGRKGGWSEKINFLVPIYVTNLLRSELLIFLIILASFIDGDEDTCSSPHVLVLKFN